MDNLIFTPVYFGRKETLKLSEFSLIVFSNISKSLLSYIAVVNNVIYLFSFSRLEDKYDGKISSSIIPFTSFGTPGKTNIMDFLYSIFIPRAVPYRFGIGTLFSSI